TDVKNVCTRGFDRQCTFDGIPNVDEFAAIGEAVRGDVQNAHDERALPENERARRQPETKEFSRGHEYSSVAQSRERKNWTSRAPRGALHRKMNRSTARTGK